MTRNFSLKRLVLIVCSSLALAFSQWSGEIVTKKEFTYGKYTARIKTNSQSGTISAFFLWSNDSTEWREIDFEVLGIRKRELQTNLITGPKTKRVTSEAWYNIGVDIHSGYHEYSLEWTPQYIAWIFDGKEKRRLTTEATQFQGRKLDVHFNFWPWDIDWSGPFDPGSLPLYMYVSHFDFQAYTPGKGINGSDFTPDWSDSFSDSSLDTTVWRKADWGTPGFGLTAPFHPNNILLKEGTLVLCISQANSSPKTIAVPLDPKDPGPSTPVSAKVLKARFSKDSKDGLRFNPSRGLGYFRNGHFVDISGKILD